ncbi:MAG: cytochrome b/b6 domain-containing protein [Armatimonadota bacterium]
MSYRIKIIVFVLIVIAMLGVEINLHMMNGRAEEDAEIIAPSDAAACLMCHEEKIDLKHFQSSAHGHLSCQVCHEGIDRFPHPEKAAAQRPACPACHALKAASIDRSIHRKVNKKSGATFACLACHGTNAHAIVEESKLTTQQQLAPCLSCHTREAKAFSASVHGSNGHQSGSKPPNCLTCHGPSPHDITAPAVAVTADATCRNCHTDIAKTLGGSAHGMAGKSGKSLSCLECHGSSAHTVKMPASRLSVTQKTALCTKCHQEETAAMAHGPHGTKQGKQPDCASCHGDDLHGVQPVSRMETQRQDATCIGCHGTVAATLTRSVHGKATMPSRRVPGCLSCHGGNVHSISTSLTPTRQQQEAACKACHSYLSASLKNSVHDRPDKQAGDHPSCLYCHGGSAHGINPPAHLSPQKRAELCGKCHSDEPRMARYGLTTGAFSSYKDTFHGKALLRFKKENSANCTDCHGLHGVLAPTDPNSPTNPRHVAETCGKCHPGSKMNFAMSGANHLRMRIKNTPLLRIEELAFRILIFSVMGFLLGMVALDLRSKIFGRDRIPERGRFIGLLIALSFFALVSGIIMAYMHIPGSGWAWTGALALMAIAFVIYYIQQRRHPHPPEKMYTRLTRSMRIQHFLLALSFTVLVLTGFPLHFADVGWTRYLMMLFGGFDGARIAHRMFGVILILNYCWHMVYLVYLWKQAQFSLRSWTMFPSWKDVVDFYETVKYGLGLQKTPPQYDRFQFREKFDYFADIWGTMVMGLSGLIMWFPTALGNRLPEVAFGVSYIAHSYEGLLAMMAIILWHFYNAHFNPDIFPMNPAWLTGTMPASEMEREHPMEKARMDAAQAGERVAPEKIVTSL